MNMETLSEALVSAVTLAAYMINNIFHIIFFNNTLWHYISVIQHSLENDRDDDRKRVS